MATTPQLGMTLLVSGQLQPEVTVNNDLNILDSVIGSLPAAFGNNPNTTTGLTYGYYGATLYRSGAPVTIAAGTIGMTASATNYVQRTVQGVVSVNTTGYLTGNIPMATVVTGSTAITTITDTRPAGYDLTGRAVVEIGAPTGLALTTATTGGTIAASTDCTYRISAVYPWGESAASAEVSITTGGSTATNENTLTWAALPAGATSANIYGRTAGGELLIANVLAGTLTYTDTGSVTPAGALPTGTLTLTAEQYPFRIISLQGVLTGATAVVFPATAQEWLVENETTGDALSVQTSGQATPLVLVPGAQMIYTDGTNVGNIINGTPVTSFNTRTGAVTLESADVTGALGYAPMNNTRTFLQVTNSYHTGPSTATTSTTGGTLPASTTYYYWIAPVLADGPMFVPYTAPHVTTGSGTTNSNTVSWTAQTGAVSYSVYRSTTSNPASALLLVSGVSGLSYTDTGAVTPSGTPPGYSNGAFSQIPFSRVVVDTAAGWSSATQEYTVPITGKYLIISNYRYSDSSPTGISYSLNTNANAQDSPSDVWFMTPTPATGQPPRNGAINTKVESYTAGTTLKMFSYAGAPMVGIAASLNILFLGP